jgi:hypothetical protein
VIGQIDPHDVVTVDLEAVQRHVVAGLPLAHGGTARKWAGMNIDVRTAELPATRPLVPGFCAQFTAGLTAAADGNATPSTPVIDRTPTAIVANLILTALFLHRP